MFVSIVRSGCVGIPRHGGSVCTKLVSLVRLSPLAAAGAAAAAAAITMLMLRRTLLRRHTLASMTKFSRCSHPTIPIAPRHRRARLMSWSTGTGTETPGTVDSPVVGGGGGGDSGGGDSATNSPIRTAVRGAKNPQRASHSNALASSQGSGALAVMTATCGSESADVSHPR